LTDKKILEELENIRKILALIVSHASGGFLSEDLNDKEEKFIKRCLDDQ